MNQESRAVGFEGNFDQKSGRISVDKIHSHRAILDDNHENTCADATSPGNVAPKRFLGTEPPFTSEGGGGNTPGACRAGPGSAGVNDCGFQVQCSYNRFRARREQLNCFEGLSAESQGQNLALAVLSVPCLLDSGVMQWYLDHKKQCPARTLQ